MKTFILIALILGVAICQQAPPPCKAVLLENGKEPCDKAGIEKVVEDIYDNGYFVYVLNERKYIPSLFPGEYTTSATVQAAIKEALATKGKGIIKSDSNDKWDATTALKNSQTLACASTLDGTTVNYFHFEFHLNMQGRMIADNASYIKAHKYLACQTKNEWIQKQFN